MKGATKAFSDSADTTAQLIVGALYLAPSIGHFIANSGCCIATSSITKRMFVMYSLGV